MNLYNDIGSIKGVGPKTKNILNNCGIFSVLDLLLYIPRDYEKIYIQNNQKTFLNEGKIIINCTVVRIDKDIRTNNRKVISTVVFKNGNNIIKGKWFNQPYMKEKFRINKDYSITGKLQDYKGENVIVNPAIVNNAILAIGSKNENVDDYKIIPKYPLKEGITNNLIIKIIGSVLENILITENMPVWIIKKYNFCSLDKAIRNIHCPSNDSALLEAQRRLKFQELFAYSLKVLMLKEYLAGSKEGIAFNISPDLKVLKERLPFTLTSAQNKVIREVLVDQKKNKQMNRLVQGDVGSGKTIVAIISMFNIIKNGYQASMIAPTEILAHQHYIEIQNILKDFNINIAFLSGSTSQKKKESIKNQLMNGDIDILVGTHAILEDDVVFKNLGMVVTDEQHRFGVMQRSKLFNKGKNIDVLVMTATPIPRTLALYLYGDLDVSIIDELPPGRQTIETFYMDESRRDKVYNFAVKEIKNGRQVYVVCPLVEDNDESDISSVEKLYETLKKNYFKNIEISILHGKMPNKAKDEIMNSFKEGKIKVLVATTVIEVGINVPNATVMIVENAERFGLAQLHQLRGRVGRGIHKSYCVLVAKINNEIVKKRLDIIQNSSDGFKIAEEDLKIRGGGELFGIRQHGESNLVLADIIGDIELLKLARQEAIRLINSTEDIDIKIKNDIFKNIENTSKLICFN